MRVPQLLMISALILGTAAPAAAQNDTTTAVNQAAPATEKVQAPKPKAAPAADKICKRMTGGKICRTAEQWKQYDQMN